jgi:hypothetical protein
MVWIQIIKEDEIVKDDLIEKISWEEKSNENASLIGFFAHVMGKKYLICYLDLLDFIPEHSCHCSTEEFSKIYDETKEMLLKKVIQCISNAKREDNDQIINVNMKLLPPQ